ncbi:hypothetical protein ACS0TY_007120 [Phlomoides rotata]
MAQCMGLLLPPVRHFKSVSVQSYKPTKNFKLCIRNCSQTPGNAQKLVVEVKEKLNKEHNSLPLGKYGRDDDEMILWFLKDRKYSVKDAVSKLTKAIRWHHEFGASELSEESVESAAKTGKAYVHDHLDVYGRPVLIGNLSKHIPGDQEPYEDEKLCVFLMEKAISKLPPGKEEILVIMDLRRFETHNIDIKLLPFMFDTFYNYYPSRVTQILFVDTPFIYMTVWPLVKPLLEPYASLVTFCSAKAVRDEYFTTSTVPAVFRD